ncbi:MmpS family transport accessory protein [Thermomonospora amylolytica]|uniref:MmpS family transport accessory protein n=1 Tax=Thermomonospora amylolytica TaxID=1411117 RepID=UPI001F23AD9D|nr:MmpS family transport accessory protein [Thermomonospora amylolytica]
MNGQVTEDMCDLLTPADYAQYGHPQMPYESKEISADQPDRVVCRRILGSTFQVALRPSAKTAELEYEQTLRRHKERMLSDRRQTILVADLVRGADASWFDYATLGIDGSEFVEYEIQARRGSLLVSITMTVNDKRKGQDPKTTLAGLAQRALERLPNVGTQDPAQTPTVVYELLGKGTARQIGYWDSEAHRYVQRTKVKLPWRLELPFDPQEAKTIPFSLTGGIEMTHTLQVIRCRVSVGGRVLVEQANPGFTSCLAHYRG